MAGVARRCFIVRGRYRPWPARLSVTRLAQLQAVVSSIESTACPEQYCREVVPLQQPTFRPTCARTHASTAARSLSSTSNRSWRARRQRPSTPVARATGSGNLAGCAVATATWACARAARHCRRSPPASRYRRAPPASRGESPVPFDSTPQPSGNTVAASPRQAAGVTAGDRSTSVQNPPQRRRRTSDPLRGSGRSTSKFLELRLTSTCLEFETLCGRRYST